MRQVGKRAGAPEPSERSLVEVTARLEGLVGELRAELASSTTEGLGALSSYDNHPAEAGSATFRRELDVTILRQIERRRDEAERALQKVREGSYGICDRCGRRIDEARLQARPESVLCLPCAEVEAAWMAPQDEEAPLSLGSEAMRTPMKMTGEDTGQELARSGTFNSPQDTPPTVDGAETFGGLTDPAGRVEDVEKQVNVTGAPILETSWARPHRQGDSTGGAESRDGGG